MHVEIKVQGLSQVPSAEVRCKYVIFSLGGIFPRNRISSVTRTGFDCNDDDHIMLNVTITYHLNGSGFLHQDFQG